MNSKLSFYTLFDHPLDYPEEYVIRVFNLLSGGDVVPEAEIFFKSKSLDECHRKMRGMGLYWITRQTDDDPVIMGTYI